MALLLLFAPRMWPVVVLVLILGLPGLIVSWLRYWVKRGEE
jgi:hypothetical protein